MSNNGTMVLPPIVYLEPQTSTSVELYIYGLVLVLIPTATILGNALVIISVLRFKALHSAINFMILGLAIADLMVALFVMPYAVYVYIQGGYWLLGSTMCNLYTATDVACSTASITLLALISFDRYQAISHPIQYSRQSQKIKRVVKLFAGVWVYSFCVASPIVLGFNDPPVDVEASPFECRFYNAYFSILSSLVSFVIPCCVVMFVYVRIIIALKRREKAAKQRKAVSVRHLSKKNEEDGHEKDAAGEIVAAPAINMMMAALPNLNRQIRRYERHKHAVNRADEDEEAYSSEDYDSLSENVNVETNDFISEIQTSNSRSSTAPLPDFCQINKAFHNGRPSIFVPPSAGRKASMPTSKLVPGAPKSRKQSAYDLRNQFREAMGSMAEAAIAFGTSNGEDSPNKFQKQNFSEPPKTLGLRSISEDRQQASNSNPELIIKREAISEKAHRYVLSHSPPSKNFVVTLAAVEPAVKHPNNLVLMESMTTTKDLNKPSVQNGGTYNPTVTFRIPSPKPALRRGSSVDEISRMENGGLMRNTFSDETDAFLDQSKETSRPRRFQTGERLRRAKLRQRSATDLIHRDGSEHGGLAIGAAQTVSLSTTETDDHPNKDVVQVPSQANPRRSQRASLKRKVKKSQRKEKRATKTLGIVVGTFLVCWVPFFTLNILNAVCVQLDLSGCQIGFGPFFYSTWIGYMNSFMNPVIYTIFNAEFRRAFKSLIIGRKVPRGRSCL